MPALLEMGRSHHFLDRAKTFSSLLLCVILVTHLNSAHF